MGLSASLYSVTTQTHSSCPALWWKDAFAATVGGWGWWMLKNLGVVRKGRRQSGLFGTVSHGNSRYDGKSWGNMLWGYIKDSCSRAREGCQRRTAGFLRVTFVPFPIMDATPTPKTAQEHIIILRTHTQTHTGTVQHLPVQTLAFIHAHINRVSRDTQAQPAVGPPPLSVTPDEVRSIRAVAGASLAFWIVCVWVSMNPSNYRQLLHIHWWSGWLGIPRGITPKLLAGISSADTERCRENCSSYIPPQRHCLPSPQWEGKQLQVQKKVSQLFSFPRFYKMVKIWNLVFTKVTHIN